MQQAKELADKAGDLARSEARLAAAEARDVLRPALPSLRLGAVGAALGTLGAGLLLLPLLRSAAARPAACFVGGAGALVAGALLLGRAYRELPPDLGARIRDVLSSDVSAAADAATRH